MWTRVRDSIVTPRNVVEYRHDSMWRVFLYLLMFVLLLSTKTAITVSQFDGVTSDVKNTYINNIEKIDDTCYISAEQVVCENQQNNLLLEDALMSFYVDGRDELVMQDYEDIYNIVIMKKSMFIIIGNQVIEEIPLSSVITEDLDFSLQDTDSEALYNSMFRSVDNIIAQNKTLWAPLMISMEVISNMLLFLFFVLISSWFLKMRFKVIPFKQLFKMTVYSSTLLYVILILNSLYNLSIFIVLLLVIFAVRQNSKLSLELLRRLTKKS
jgi:hypothetical protein